MSVPAVAGYQPNQFQPKPIHSGPLALNSSPTLPPWPAPGLASSLVEQGVPSWQEDQPLAGLLVPSPSQTKSGLPAAKGAATLGPGAAVAGQRGAALWQGQAVRAQAPSASESTPSARKSMPNASLIDAWVLIQLLSTGRAVGLHTWWRRSRLGTRWRSCPRFCRSRSRARPPARSRSVVSRRQRAASPAADCAARLRSPARFLGSS